MEKSYDLVVVGTGSASAAASRCRAAGWSAAVVDYHPFGGTCALRGCHPKKMLVAGAEAVHAARSMADNGVRAPKAGIDWQALMRFKRSETDPAPRIFADGYAKAGIDTYRGRARFVGPTALAVGEDRLVGRHVLIAAGAMPAPQSYRGADLLTSSEEFLELDRLPRRIVFVGGGFISFEFAHVAARAGARVTILHRGSRPLKGFDPDLVDLLVRRTRELGIEVVLEADVCGLERTRSGVAVVARVGGDERRFEAGIAVHGAGRVPEIEELALEAAGVARDGRGVTVNEYLQSVSNPAVYAGGDAAASGPKLTPAASRDAEVVATNLLEGNRRTADYRGIASVVFTVPPLAAVGLTEEAARARGLRFRVNWEDTGTWFGTRRVGETASGYKVLVEEDGGRLLGAHLLGPHADEVINLFAVALRFDIPAADLKQTLFAYPTSGSDIVYML